MRPNSHCTLVYTPAYSFSSWNASDTEFTQWRSSVGVGNPSP